MARSTLGIRREDKNRWERRVPLTPEAVAELVRAHGASVRVEASPNRAFPDDAYRSTGAELVADASGADVFVAVKEIPERWFRPGGVYLYFSHTVKGQEKNMPMLRRLVELGCSLIDYERVVDDAGRRLIFFSWFAGAAGMVDTLHVLGRRLDWLGLENPFSDFPPTWRHGSLPAVAASLEGVSARIRAGGLPRELAPFVVGFAGYGNVARGAWHVFDQLPVEEVAPEDLPRLPPQGSGPNDRLFKVVFREEHMVAPRDPAGTFQLQEYFAHPERYRSTFTRHVPYLDVLLNGIYWTESYPRLITLQDLRQWFAGPVPPRLKVVGDVSCDLHGSVESLVKVTTPDEPAFTWDPLAGTARDGCEGRGLVMMAVDNLPCELPAEASEAFSEALLPFMPGLLEADFSLPLDRLVLPAPLRRALILHRGEFTPEYRYMEGYLRKPEAS